MTSQRSRSKTTVSTRESDRDPQGQDTALTGSAPTLTQREGLRPRRRGLEAAGRILTRTAADTGVTSDVGGLTVQTICCIILTFSET